METSMCAYTLHLVSAPLRYPPVVDVPVGHVLHAMLPSSLFSLPPGAVVGTTLPFPVVAGCLGGR